MNASTACALAVLWPLLAVVLVALLRNRPNWREGATLAVASSLFAGIVAWILPSVMEGARPRFELVEILPGLHLLLVGRRHLHLPQVQRILDPDDACAE